MGKASTSVGPSLSIHCSLSSAMVPSSTKLEAQLGQRVHPQPVEDEAAQLRDPGDVDGGPGLLEHLDAHGRLAPWARWPRTAQLALDRPPEPVRRRRDCASKSS